MGLRTPEEKIRTTLVIFGSSGDLARTRIIPAIQNLKRRGDLAESSSVVGVDKRPPSGSAAAAGIVFIRGDLRSRDTYGALAARFATPELKRSNFLFYLATPPHLFGTVVRGLKTCGLSRAGPGWRRVVVEKPLGSDLRSARALERALHLSLREDQVFRMDHYLGKEAVRGIAAFRFAEAAFEPIWNNKFIDHIRIVAASTKGVEGRGRTYDRVGVVRDMVQNHLLQVLCLIAMEPPESDDVTDTSRAKVNLLESIRRLSAKDVVWGQYRGYKEEDGVSKTSDTPTFVSLRLLIDNARWRGVPFYLRTGLRLARDVTEVVVAFKRTLPAVTERGRVCWDSITFRIGPNPGILLTPCKAPGNKTSPGPTKTTFTHMQPRQAEYEVLLREVLHGSNTLFTPSRVNLLAWEVIDPIVRIQRRQHGRLLHIYEPGSQGPPGPGWLRKT